MVDGLLKDKALVYGEDMELTVTGDFAVVSGYEVILQAAQNRVLSLLDTRKYDDAYGSELQNVMHNMPAIKVTDAIMYTYVSFALQPMILDGRVQNIDSVKIIDRTVDSLTIEIILTLGTFSGSVVIEMPNFIS